VTPFCRAVVDLIKASPNQSLDAYTLRISLAAQGMGKHPAGIAMNLTKLAFRGEYVTCFTHNNYRVFLLTEKGKNS
jgi:hypothetical protein